MSSHIDRFGADELRLQLGLPVLKEHGDHLSDILAQFIQGLALRMSAGKPGTYPIYNRVSGQCSTTIVNDFTIPPEATANRPWKTWKRNASSAL